MVINSSLPFTLILSTSIDLIFVINSYYDIIVNSSMATVYHKHHIIPKHMGGLDIESNLISLTVEEHTQAHKDLYDKYGKQQDYMAWKCLSGQLGKEEILLMRSKLGASQPGEKNPMFGKNHSQEAKEKMSDARVGVNYTKFWKTPISEVRANQNNLGIHKKKSCPRCKKLMGGANLKRHLASKQKCISV